MMSAASICCVVKRDLVAIHATAPTALPVRAINLSRQDIADAVSAPSCSAPKSLRDRY
jgi:hypothetical protein